MRIKTLQELNEHLDTELAWRKKELTTLMFLINGLRSHQKEPVLRAMVCMLYAHWEGFVKFAATSYVSFVDTRRFSYDQLAANFVALGLRGRITQAGLSNQSAIRTELTAYLMSDLSDRARLNPDQAISTEANLNLRVLRNILSMLGIDDSNYLTKGLLIDETLLGTRNGVAHGRDISIDEVSYVNLHTEIIALIEQIRNDVENAAVLGTYRR